MYFFFNDTATTEIYPLSLHDALPIYTGSFSPCTSTVTLGRSVPLLIRFGTTTETYAMLPYGSPAGCPLPSRKLLSKAPDRVPSVCTLYQPVPVMSVPETPTGISTPLTRTVRTP